MDLQDPAFRAHARLGEIEAATQEPRRQLDPGRQLLKQRRTGAAGSGAARLTGGRLSLILRRVAMAALLLLGRRATSASLLSASAAGQPAILAALAVVLLCLSWPLRSAWRPQGADARDGAGLPEREAEKMAAEAEPELLQTERRIVTETVAAPANGMMPSGCSSCAATGAPSLRRSETPPWRSRPRPSRTCAPGGR